MVQKATQGAKWTGYFKFITPQPSLTSMSDNQDMSDGGAYNNYTWYQRLVQGSTARLTRYREYDLMDNDVEVARSLDTISEEITGNNVRSDEPLDVHLLTAEERSPESTTVLTIRTALRRWFKLHQLDSRLFTIARMSVKYGDCFFRRGKTAWEGWMFVHPKDVVAAIVSDKDLTKVMGWQIKKDVQKPMGGSYGLPIGGKSDTQHETEIVSSKDVIRFTLCDDMSDSQPFGESILRPVYRSHKQKELLEDAILIYRIQRAPERRVFYIDVGKMPPQRVKTYLEGIKNEIKQKRVPTTSGGQAEVDTVYNPHSMCLALNTEIPLLDGRTLTLQEMIDEHEEGKENWIYSIDPKTGNVVPGPVSWAGITRRNAETIKLTFDNGDELICTPDHKIPVQGKGFVEAKDLTENDSLFPFHEKQEQLNSKTKTGKKTKGNYKSIYNPATKSWKPVYKMVASFLNKNKELKTFTHDEKHLYERKNTIHHKDYNSLNDNPNNLVMMSHLDHAKMHGVINANQEIIFAKDLFERFEEIANKDIFIKFKDLLNEMSNDEIFMRIHRRDNGNPEDGKKYKIKTNEMRQKIFFKFMKAYGYKNWRDYQNKQIQKRIREYNTDKLSGVYNCSLLQYIIKLVGDVSIHNFTILNHLKDNKEILNEFLGLYDQTFNEEDSFKTRRKKLEVPTSRTLEKISTYYGYKDFKHLVNESANFNHRVVKIENAEVQDTGTLTIDKEEKYHNYHTFATKVLFLRNSEDFFFACLSMKSKTYLTDGREITIEEAKNEYEEGKENYVYSIDQKTGEKIEGKIEWAGYTRKDADLLRVHLNNDEFIDCTPDHKFVLKDGNECEAQYLTEETLLSCYENEISILDVEVLPYKEDTGCLYVIDPGENHNFAISAGVYVKNSRPDGRGSKVETLPGGQGLGELADLEYFQRKVWRGLRIPSSYMQEQDGGGAMFNDGKVGMAYIQELRFALFISRLQVQLEKTLDLEFKRFLSTSNVKIDEEIYEIRLPEPSNFGKYRQLELDTQLLGAYASADGVAHLSKRFSLKRYLQLSDEQIITNERLKAEELGLDPDDGKENFSQIYAAEAMGGEMGGMGGGFMGGGMEGGMGGMEGGEAGAAGGEAAGGVPPA